MKTTFWPFVSWLIAFLPLCCSAWFIAELAAGLRPKRIDPRRKVTDGTMASSVILIPAHNEVGGIAQVISALRAVCPASCRLLVVADNCTDATATAARTAGAEVAERHDPDQRGKGFALAFGRDYLADDPPDVVLVVDADCRLAPGSVEALVGAVMANGRPAQALDVIEPDLALPPLAQISSFAMLVKNVVRQRGLMRLGGFSLLCGTGMAFAWSDFSAASLATGNVVEDLGLAIGWIGSGVHPQLVEGGRVTSPAASVADSVAQRSRWEHGFLRTALRHAVPELFGGVITASRARIALGLHLMVPPLALLLTLSTAVLGVVTAIACYTNIWLSAVLLGAVVALDGLLVVAVWASEGRQTLSVGSLFRAPMYILWKLPIYLRFMRAPQTAWTRTRREADR